MAVIFNESTVPAEATGRGVRRQHLLAETRVKGTRILLDRLTLAASGDAQIAVPPGSVAWLQILEGNATFDLAGACRDDRSACGVPSARPFRPHLIG
jgi:hypothetical protein